LRDKFDTRVTVPLAEVLEHVTQLESHVSELADIVKVQVEMGNQTTELLGRLLAASSTRLDALEDSLGRLTSKSATTNRPATSRKNRPREEASTASTASGEPS
jgi:hypothetical protein